MKLSKLTAELGRMGRVIPDAPMCNYTTWRVGGPADLLFIPESEEGLIQALRLVADCLLPLTVIGNGSNLLVSDQGIRGLVIRISGNLADVKVSSNTIEAGAGAHLPTLARIAQRAGLSGLEFAAGIPASLGGALVMNAGAMGQQLADLVMSAVTLDYQGHSKVWAGEELGFKYRSSRLQGCAWIVLRVSLMLRRGDREEISRRLERNLATRRHTQPLDLPSAGSVFRNPPGTSAGKLIEEAGLKGLRRGGAQVSEKHANFIVNRGQATATDILGLIRLVQQRVRERFGVELVPEVRLVGEEG